MVGAVLIVIALVVVLPVVIIMSGGILSGIIAFFVKNDVDASNPDSELLELNG
jgi:hypothetical protein